MAEADPKRLGPVGKWGTLLLLVAALASGLLALPTTHSAGRSVHRASDLPSLATVRTLSGSLSLTHQTTADTSPYAQLIPPDAPGISAASAYLMDARTGEVFYSNNALNEVAMASTTKIMTAIVALTFGKPTQTITIHQDAVNKQNGENSVAGLTLGDTLTLHDLLYALLLPSGDDAAVAIADGVAGSEANFVHMMNMEAALLGLVHTHYVNVHGLDEPGHYTTVGDLAHIARVAMSFPLFAEIVKTPVYVVQTPLHGQYTWHTTNELLTDNLYQGAIGVKTGYTGNAGYCLVFAATRNGSTLIGVLLGERDDTGIQRFLDATALLNWGFAREQNIDLWMEAIAGKHTGG